MAEIKKSQPQGKKAPVKDKDTSYRAQRFWEQRMDHANKKGQPSISLHELQIGFQGYLRALDKKSKKYEQPSESSSGQTA